MKTYLLAAALMIGIANPIKCWEPTESRNSYDSRPLISAMGTFTSVLGAFVGGGAMFGKDEAIGGKIVFFSTAFGVVIKILNGSDPICATLKCALPSLIILKLAKLCGGSVK